MIQNDPIYESIALEARKQMKADGGGLRYNADKNRLDLLPVEWSLALGEVMTAGAKKYAARNWERGMSWSIMVGCALRHLYKFMRGERYDPETGCHHLAHCAWNVLALMSYDVRAIGQNDLVYPDKDQIPTQVNLP